MKKSFFSKLFPMLDNASINVAYTSPWDLAWPFNRLAAYMDNL